MKVETWIYEHYRVKKCFQYDTVSDVMVKSNAGQMAVVVNAGR